MNAFKNRLNDYFKDLETEMLVGKSSSKIFPNPVDKGQIRETLYSMFLTTHAPKNAEVLFGGFLFGQDGEESKQLDLIVIDSKFPRFIMSSNKAFACIDGCIAVISIKSQLDKGSLFNELDSFSCLPDKVPYSQIGKLNGVKIDESDYQELPLKVIFAFDGMSLDKYNEALNEYYTKHKDTPSYKRPNIIHINSKILSVRTTKDNQVTRNSVLQPENLIKGSFANFHKTHQGFPYTINEIYVRSRLLDFLLFDYVKINHLVFE